ncbi:hypothetical protein Clacol_008945 [Clathrus columnatus]|uniref:Uncharacterized protein n=1 Tax=Clathrus columnatus TaxID=1419009 RepID=A0AAV5APQ7_9AGAM|nr:hypothetical protein Clacol_008945 [Clathrus columnatus]
MSSSSDSTTLEKTAGLKAALASTATSVAALSGSCAGSIQALAAAPAENVRILLEGGQSRSSWSVAWREVFAGTESLTSKSPKPAKHREEVRRVQAWVKEVRGMAGRGWQGLGFGIAKDSCAFAVFFSIFEISRRAAVRARSFSARVLGSVPPDRLSSHVKSHAPRVVHGFVIVGGGVFAGLSYDFVCRPFDVARRTIASQMSSCKLKKRPIPSTNHDHPIIPSSHSSSSRARSIVNILANKFKSEGPSSFFVSSLKSALSSSSTGTTSKWLYTLGRLGPWGIAFLAWETFGPELSPVHGV